MKKDYVQNYLNAYREMKSSAIEKIKNYGKTLEVYEIRKKRLMEQFGYKSKDEIPQEELDDCICNTSYSCVYEGKHGMLYPCQIVMVRYNSVYNDVDVYLESDDGYIAEWFTICYVGWDFDGAYMTIHDFITD